MSHNLYEREISSSIVRNALRAKSKCHRYELYSIKKYRITISLDDSLTGD